MQQSHDDRLARCDGSGEEVGAGHHVRIAAPTTLKKLSRFFISAVNRVERAEVKGMKPVDHPRFERSIRTSFS